MMIKQLFALSLLSPAGTDGKNGTIPEQTFIDLDVDSLINSVLPKGAQASFVKNILASPPMNPDVIRYRQEILRDLLRNGELVNNFQELLPKVEEITYSVQTRRNLESPILDMLWRLGELELFRQCVEGFGNALDGVSLESRGLIRFREIITEIFRSEEFQSLKNELPGMQEAIRKKRSITVGINLNERLRPVEAALLSVNETVFRKSPLIDRLLGGKNEYAAEGPIHRDPSLGFSGRKNFPLSPLFQDLADILKPAFRKISRVLSKYLSVQTGAFSNAARELRFYDFAEKAVRRLTGMELPVCIPEINEDGTRTGRVREMYSPLLAGQMEASEIVKNDFYFDNRESSFWVLTGPNQGGKTTFLRAAGIYQILGQSGLFIPAESGSITPADTVVTHFPAEEGAQGKEGRLAEEASRLSKIFDKITSRSMIFLNETLSSTAPGEGVYIGREILKSFLHIGVRGIYATHLHELAEDLGTLNKQFPAAAAGSLAAGVNASPDEETGIKRTYRISPGPPLGRSYARDIAERFGISYEKIKNHTEKNG